MDDLRPDNLCPCCNGSGLNTGDFRVLEVNMLWDETSPVRPLAFQKVGNNESLVEIQDCDNTRWLFDYRPGFTEGKKRKIIVKKA